MHCTPAPSAFVFHQPSHATTLQQSLSLLATHAGLEASHGSGHAISSIAHETVPCRVGTNVGTAVGAALGITDGSLVGSELGASDGSALGKSDGP